MSLASHFFERFLLLRMYCQAHVAKRMARLQKLVHDVPMLSAGVPCPKETGEFKDCCKLRAKVAFTLISLVVSFPTLFPSRLGGKFQGGLVTSGISVQRFFVTASLSVHD